MNSHDFLSFVQNKYDFEHANLILCETNLKNCWKHWFTAELVHLCNISSPGFQAQTDVYYPGNLKSDEPGYLSYRPGKTVTNVSSKRGASRCDFSFLDKGKQFYFEIRCVNHDSLVKRKELAKYTADQVRIDMLKKANPELNVMAILVFYGAFSNKEVEIFSPMDNGSRCSYVLDSGQRGSSSIFSFEPASARRGSQVTPGGLFYLVSAHPETHIFVLQPYS